MGGTAFVAGLVSVPVFACAAPGASSASSRLFNCSCRTGASLDFTSAFAPLAAFASPAEEVSSPLSVAVSSGLLGCSCLTSPIASYCCAVTSLSGLCGVVSLSDFSLCWLCSDFSDSDLASDFASGSGAAGEGSASGSLCSPAFYIDALCSHHRKSSLHFSSSCSATAHRSTSPSPPPPPGEACSRQRAACSLLYQNVAAFNLVYTRCLMNKLFSMRWNLLRFGAAQCHFLGTHAVAETDVTTTAAATVAIRTGG